MFLNSFNYFRGIAIMFIIAGHGLSLANFSYQTRLGESLYNLTVGGTTFFVFISGFLFHHVFSKNFSFTLFFKKKLKYVLGPFIVMSILPLTMYVIKDDLDLHIVNKIVLFILTGKYLLAYWYVPFIMIIFAMSPLFIRYLKLTVNYKLTIAFLLLICSVFLQRPIFSVFSVFQSVVYFTPVYMFGMICSENQVVLYEKLKGKEFYLLVLVIILAFIQTYSGIKGNYHKPIFRYEGVDLQLIQKIIFSLFFMIWLRRFENRKIDFLNLVSMNSFGIFFIHGYFLGVLNKVKLYFDFSFSQNSFLIYCLVVLVLFFLSLLFSMFVRKIFPKHSRYIIGS